MSRVALVTGAARGIGAATVAGLVAEGWSVLAVDRGDDDRRVPYAMGSEEELRSVVARAVRAGPGTAAAHLADATDPVGMEAAVVDAEARYGGVDAVIAVAGVIAGGVPLWEMPEDQLRAVLDVDLGGPILAAQLGIPALLRETATPRRALHRRGVGRRHPGAPGPGRLQRRQGRGGRVDPGPGGGSGAAPASPPTG